MRAALLAVVLAAALAACGGAPKRPTPSASPPAASSELSAALAPLSWWPGHWQSPEGHEHWVAASGALYGVSFPSAGDFEVMIVDDSDGGKLDGVLRLWAMPGGTKQVTFTKTAHTASSAEFANPAHDAPKSITYGREGDDLVARLAGGVDLAFRFRPAPYVSAPELEQADLAFAAAVKERGVPAWVDAFAPDGWMWSKGGVVPRDRVGELMAPILTTGLLAWAPIASGTHGGLGYTVGKATFTGKTAAEGWRSTYVTIWKQQPGGGWKVLFDTGRGVDEP
ncbi:MAG: hypothetical protein JNL83_19720 [Myxococcales bacterium]|nr:hypothetical protein [Myxococcales bacterium]